MAFVREQRNAVNYLDPICLQLRWTCGWPIVMRPASNDNYTFKEIIVDDAYGAVVERVNNAKYVLDLGANIGLASVFFARYWPEMHVVCVEPDKGNSILLETNLAPLLKTGRAALCLGAVWGQSGSVGLSDLERGHVNQFSCHDLQAGELGVPAYTIDELIRIHGLPRVDLLKMDVEGAEVNILTGDTSWLDLVNAIAIEFHGTSRQDSQYDHLMHVAGFEVLDDGGHTVLAIRT